MLWSNRFKILTLAAFLLAMAGFGYVLYQSIYGWNLDRRARHQAQSTARNFYLMCRTAQASIQRSVQENIRQVEKEIARAGSAAAGPGGIDSTLLARLERVAGGEVAVYQRVGENGGLQKIRNGAAEAGGEYPGRFLPGSEPAAERLARGETVLLPGRSAGAWVMMALIPLGEKSAKELSGALQLILPSEELDHLVRRIMAALIGRDGYVFVLGGKGEQRGRYLISKDGLRDGERIWDSLDSTGRPFIQAIVVQALALAEQAGGEYLPVAFERYPWQNPGEKLPRHKTVAITYFEPWDWVIGAGYYEDEF